MDELDLGQTIRGFTGGQKLFGRYTLVRILGRGGMGVVWLARDEKLDRDVALKFLPDLVVHDAAVLDELKRETKRSLELTHHNIVRIHDFAEDAQSACISMEYVDGPTLSALRVQRENKVFEVSELAPWIEQTCEALAYAHDRAKIVHRDLKPANLMLNSKGELKVADFGIARSLTDSVSMLTMARGSSGTLVYMSPQQLAGLRASRSDDIYSLGATIYELLTSKPPFYSGNIDAQIKEITPMSMAERRAELELSTASPISAEWERTILACLAKDPARRPQSAREVAQRLGLIVPQYGPTITPAPQIAASKTKPRNRKLVVVATVAALGLIGGALVWYFGSYLAAHKTKQTSSAVQPTQGEAKTAMEKERLAEEQPIKQQEETKQKLEPVNFAAVTKEHPYENNLGMKFVPVQGTNVLFSIWETRVKDFEAFVEATGHNATGGMYSLEKGGWKQAGKTWKDPGFEQTGEHAVCGVSWEDATAFCEWLTKEERKAGRIAAEQSYRLPSDVEWSAAVGLKKESGKNAY